MEDRPGGGQAGRLAGRPEDRAGRGIQLCIRWVDGCTQGEACRQAGRQRGSQTGRAEDTQAGRKSEGQAARKRVTPECSQEDRKSARQVGSKAGNQKSSQAGRPPIGRPTGYHSDRPIGRKADR